MNVSRSYWATTHVDNPEEEEIESLCKLLTTVGGILDTQKVRAHMDVYFSRMKELTKSPHVTPRMQFMLQVCPFPLSLFSLILSAISTGYS